MALDLELFAGLTPYATELFGIYQPLLGWKAKRKHHWVHKQQTPLLAAAIDRLHSLAPSRASLLEAPRPLTKTDLMSHEIDEWADTETGRALQNAAIAFVARSKRLPEASDWKSIAADAGFEKVLARLARPTPTNVEAAQRTSGALRREAAVAGALQYLADTASHVLHHVLRLETVSWPLTTAVTDPLATFDPATQRAILSPIGLVNVFREYFFELDSFLGPSVGHFWVSPGGTLEVYEIHTTRTIQESTTELSQTSDTTVARTSSDSSEISDKVNQQNSTNTSLGISASGGVNLGVYHASASASFGLQQNQQTAQETAHKEARSQSESVSNEIRRDFKTTFKTTVDITDTSSRRYVLQNTSDKLVNYELRRKMRRVGVQLQHIGTELCWQMYVDNPGQSLGVGILVHAAAPSDLVSTPPPEAPPELEPKKDQTIVNFAFEPLDAEATDDGEDEDYSYGHDIHEDSNVGFIRHRKLVNCSPPANGYRLQSATVVSYTGTDPNNDPPSKVATECHIKSADSFELVLTFVNFNDQPSIDFNVELLWSPPKISDETQKAYEEAKKKYNEETARAAHQAYVTEVRDRVNLAGQVQKRAEDDLRDEERTVIFRRMVHELSGIKHGPGPHLMSELIRAIFDVDKMLYYVAEDWWMPRTYYPQRLGEKLQLTADDRVSWGGDKEKSRTNYLITEESVPAPMGASLGWLLQLDGDPHRNAFLNTPWAKAVLPIRPGREAAALNWLMRADVEGSEDLDAKYGGTEPELAGKTIGEAAMALAEAVSAEEDSIESTLATETVYESGFNPLDGGFRTVDAPFQIFDQWIEVLPTDQVVAVEYLPPPVVPVP